MRLVNLPNASKFVPMIYMKSTIKKTLNIGIFDLLWAFSIYKKATSGVAFVFNPTNLRTALKSQCCLIENQYLYRNRNISFVLMF